MLAAVQLPASAQAADVFEQGIEAFRAQRLEQAKHFFLQARNQGQTGPKLHYNLGVVHYRLKQYAEAERHFIDALRFPVTRQIALYNLGRCAEALGATDRAAGYYRQAQVGKDPRVATLARKAKNNLQAHFWSVWQLNGQLGLGFDSSVVGLTDQVTAQPLRTADLFEEARFDATFDRIPVPDGELAVRFDIYQLAYETEQQVDLQSVAGSLNWRASEPRHGRWGWRLQYAQEWLDNRAYQIRTGLRARYEYGWQRYWLTLDAEAEWFESQQARLEGIDGGRYQLSASILGRVWTGIGVLRVGTQLNERRATENSPRRVSLNVFWRSPQWRGLAWQPSLQWRDSQYSNDVFDKERRLKAQVRITGVIDDHWQSFVDLEYEDNESELRSRDYHHLRAMISLRWSRN